MTQNDSFSVQASDLKKLNDLPSNHLTKGQKLKVKAQTLEPRRIRQRSRSLNTHKVLRVFSPSDFASIKVPSGTIPHIVSNGQKVNEIAELYDMDVRRESCFCFCDSNVPFYLLGA